MHRLEGNPYEILYLPDFVMPPFKEGELISTGADCFACSLRRF